MSHLAPIDGNQAVATLVGLALAHLDDNPNRAIELLSDHTPDELVLIATTAARRWAAATLDHVTDTQTDGDRTAGHAQTRRLFAEMALYATTPDPNL